jgi:uncharacterized membrane protein YccC
MASATWAAFQRALTRWEHEKIYPAIALRNAAGVMLPLGAATLAGQPSLGLVMCIGALNVAYSDGVDPIQVRGRRMLLSSFFCGMAVLVGGMAGRYHPAAVAAASLWAFGAGLVVALGATAADLGTISLVTLVVFASRPLDSKQAWIAGAAAFCGGLLQTVLSLALLPIGRYQQDRRILSGIFGELSRVARASTKAGSAPLATVEFTHAVEVLRARNRDFGPHAEMFAALLSQAERVRLRLLTLARLRRRLERDENASAVVSNMEDFREAAAQITEGMRKQLETGSQSWGDAAMVAAERAVECARRLANESLSSFSQAAARDATQLMDSIAGQLRASRRMVDAKYLLEPTAASESSQRKGLSWLALMRSRMEILRANLTFRSIAFRHAVRLAACIALGETLSATVDWQRSYWIPMTIAIVLKPDFLSTFSRGALRLGGTFGGLILATAIYRVAPLNALTDILVVGVFTLVLRWWGPANYGLLTLAISAIVVALIAGTGVAPSKVILLRGINTSIGGLLAMLAYILWPTWERSHVGEFAATLMDAYRTYLRAIRTVCLQRDGENSELDRARQAARVARTNAEASADRLGAEPATNPALVPLAKAMLASSHNFIYAAMTLETGPVEELRNHPECFAVLSRFLDHVDLMLYFLANTLRGSNAEGHNIYDLRDHYRTLAKCVERSGLPDSLVQVEADRITNALNTLRDQVLEWKTQSKPRPVT